MKMSPLINSESHYTTELIRKGRDAYMPVYSPREMILDHGKGSRLWDLDGNEYIDLGAGIAVNSLGHQEPDLVKAAIEQINKLWHTSNIYFTEPTVQLAADLVKVTFADRVYFSNSGVEANEAAVKLVRKYASIHGDSDKREIITFKGSFHGRTLAMITATAQPKYQEGFGPLPGNFTYCNFNDFEEIEKTISKKTCAVMIEPIQGEGGVQVSKTGYLQHLRDLCNQHGALLIFDEIQSGMGRTGKLFAYEWENEVQPDVVTIAKALGGGLPIGAMLATEKVATVFKVGDHGSTFGGNAVATAVARIVLKKLCSLDVMKNVEQQSQKLQTRLQQLKDSIGIFKEIRGKGLIIGAELSSDWEGQAKEITEACRLNGVLILQAGVNVLRFLPPLNITTEELDSGLNRLEATLKELISQ